MIATVGGVCDSVPRLAVVRMTVWCHWKPTPGSVDTLAGPTLPELHCPGSEICGLLPSLVGAGDIGGILTMPFRSTKLTLGSVRSVGSAWTAAASLGNRSST